MKTILILIFLTVSLFAQVIIKKPIEQFSIKDQFGKIHHITPAIKRVVFVFSKDAAHSMNQYLQLQQKGFLEKNKTLYVADVSKMPFFVRFFVLPFRGYDFSILTLEDKKVASRYFNEKFRDKIMAVTLENMIVKDILYTKKPTEVFNDTHL